MKTLGYYNGKIDELEKMTVPMLDRAGYFGDGVYDVAVSRNYHIFALDEHVDRFMNSAKLLGITPTVTKEELKELCRDLLSRMDEGDQMIYFQYSRGTDFRNHVYSEEMKPNLWMMLKPLKLKGVEETARCMTAEDKRFYICNIKTINLILNVMAAQEAERRGLDECILHRGDEVTECAHSNVSILKDRVFITHPTDNLILPGIARAHLIKACHALGIPVKERPFTLEELKNADEIIISSTSKICLRCLELDGVPTAGKDPATAKRIADYCWNEFLEETK